MTSASPDRTACRSLEAFAAEIDEVAAAHGTTRAEVLGSLIAGLEERIAEDTEVLSLARRLEAADRKPAETAFDHAIDIVARETVSGRGEGRDRPAAATTGPVRRSTPGNNPKTNENSSLILLHEDPAVLSSLPREREQDAREVGDGRCAVHGYAILAIAEMTVPSGRFSVAVSL
jgi:hypothetical protein